MLARLAGILLLAQTAAAEPPDFRQKRLNIGPAESFQWINLMRCDTALMSLVNHRYLATKPNEPGQATANATDPSPVRKNGVCFKQKAVE